MKRASRVPQGGSRSISKLVSRIYASREKRDLFEAQLENIRRLHRQAREHGLAPASSEQELRDLIVWVATRTATRQPEFRR